MGIRRHKTNLMNGSSALVWDPRRSLWLSFDGPRQVLSSSNVAEAVPILRQVEDSVRRDGVWAVGWMSYEAAPACDPALVVAGSSELPLVWFALYDEPTCLEKLPEPSTDQALEWHASINEFEYAESFAAVHEHIHRGDTYQANLSLRLRADGVPDAYTLFHSMVSTQGGKYSVFVDTGRFAVCSASPELFFERAGSEIICRPMKGTTRRTGDLSVDARSVERLTESAKERAENIMIVDMVRNDLSRIASDGSVRVTSLCEVEQYPEIFQMVSEVRAVTDISTAEIMSALFPSASITGAPKCRTMEIIKECESSPRGIYTGSLGVFMPDGRSWWNVAIRTAVVDRETQTVEYGVGSGVVWDSECAREYGECLLKGHVVQRRHGMPALFETLRYEPTDGYWLLNRHLERLAASARSLGYPCDLKKVTKELATAVSVGRDVSEPLRVRLVLDSTGWLATEVAPCPVRTTAYRVALARQPVDLSDQRLYHKTTDRAVYDNAEPAVHGVDDVLLWNERGEITESRIANVLVSLGGVLYTPPVSCGLLGGCLRQDLVERGEVKERIISVEELKRAESVFLVNSVRGIWQVEVLLSQESYELGGEAVA